jgi:hypothetical protein
MLVLGGAATIGMMLGSARQAARCAPVDALVE